MTIVAILSDLVHQSATPKSLINNQAIQIVMAQKSHLLKNLNLKMCNLKNRSLTHLIMMLEIWQAMLKVSMISTGTIEDKAEEVVNNGVKIGSRICWMLNRCKEA